MEAGTASRLSIVTDSLGASSLFGGVATSLILGALLANRLGSALRVITRTEPPDAAAVGGILQANRVRLDGKLEVEYAPLTGGYELPQSRQDFFIATSWWSLCSLLANVNPARVAYLVQEDERMFYPRGDERLKCDQTMREQVASVIINTKLLHDHLVGGHEAMTQIKNRCVWFEPAFPVSPATRLHRSGRNLFFYARPNHARNLFSLGIEVLGSAFGENLFLAPKWRVHFVGRDIPRLSFSSRADLKYHEGLTWEDYKALLATMDAGFVLMDTPHPSYPPLDLASIGAAVLTNACGSKTSLELYSENISATSTSHDALLQGLRALERSAADDERRLDNMRNDSICRDWTIALSHAVEEAALRFDRNSK